MLTLRPFRNTDSRIVSELWQRKSQELPGFFTPMSVEMFERHILDNVLFDREGFLLLFEGDLPVGFIHASFPPNEDWDDRRFDVGIIYPPVVPAFPQLQEALDLLVTGAERYLLSRGAAIWFVGGTANASPFYNGLYGPCSAEGVLQRDKAVVELFCRRGYKKGLSSRLYRILLDHYLNPVEPRVREIKRKFKFQRMPHWTPVSWWDANCGRQFNVMEWNVFDPQTGAATGRPIAGAVIYRMLTDINDNDLNAIPFALSFIGVDNAYLRRGIGTALFSRLGDDLLSEIILPIEIHSLVSEDNERLSHFLLSQGFKEVSENRLLSFLKRV
ncbi:MAG: hypothetical protein IJH68_13470 [Thermoguttaceae bacterium]|nr:hypothetical protein [Thermoguttaceae bacterium]MBQ6621145.1 hypothetical protein [Thermoguttaceae bacterium]